MLTGEQIKQKINELNQKRLELMEGDTFNTFILDQKAQTYFKRIKSLQDHCPHKSGDNGICIYCGREVEDDK